MVEQNDSKIPFASTSLYNNHIWNDKLAVFSANCFRLIDSITVNIYLKCHVSTFDSDFITVRTFDHPRRRRSKSRYLLSPNLPLKYIMRRDLSPAWLICSLQILSSELFAPGSINSCVVWGSRAANGDGAAPSQLPGSVRQKPRPIRATLLR